MSQVKNDDDAQKAAATLGLDGYPGTYQLVLGVRDYCSFVLKQYSDGKQISDPYYLWGVDKITPNAIHYTKPIVLLVNQLDFSGGDFFPAIMQDNKRVTIVGTRTAGAGGYVLEAQFPNNLGLETVRFTGSIAERVSLNPIENLGVTPDVSAPMTVNDIRNGFKNYEDEVRTVIKDLIK
jgi:C-terminal processing protease CtpA/Prc